MIVYTGAPQQVSSAIEKEAAVLRAEGKTVGIIDFQGDMQEAAHSFFIRLRKLDKEGVDQILCAGVPDEGIGEAVMDRMCKAAGNKIVSV